MTDRQDAALAASRPSVRAGGFAVAAVTVALAAHTAAGGPAPDVVTVLAAAVLVAVVHRVVLAGRERSWPDLLVGLGAVQCVLHWLFGAGPGMPGVPDASAMAHAEAGAAAEAGAVGAAGVPAWHGPDMLAAHLVAAAVLAWFLRQGERALWSAARRGVVRDRAHVLAAVVAAVLAAVTSRPAPAPAVPARTSSRSWRPPGVRGLGGRWVRGARSWRAPPSAAVRAPAA